MRAVLFGGTVPPLHAKVGEFLETDPYARARLEEAEEVLGQHVLPRFSQATESYSPEARQAYLVTCVALADRAREEDGEADVCAAASIGHLPALHYCGALSFADVMRLGEAVAECENTWNATDHGLVSHFMYRVGRDRLAELVAEVAAEGGWAEVAGHFSDTIHLLNVSAGSLPGSNGPSGPGRGARAHLPPGRAQRGERPAAGPDRGGRGGLPLPGRAARLRPGRGRRARRLRGGAAFPAAGRLRHAGRLPLVVDRLRDLGVRRVHVVGPGNLFERLTKEHFDVTVLVPDARARGLAVPDSGPARVSGGRVASTT
ncbi:ACP S-malonyltransferase [Nocardiopsis eucommiae]|uniref:ACP S-malonyltransferase n=1 Tax=Nocardiopsis eucommiae TaxID=2831970 RepID=A0A975LB27_9ACTN|nr:ACP S-malonyltransferase [Nocardiopsis eucommiae]